MYKLSIVIITLFLLGCFSSNSIARYIHLYIDKVPFRESLSNIFAKQQKGRTRNVLSDIGELSVANSHQLTTFNYQNALAWAGSVEDLAKKLSTNVDEIQEHIEWVLSDGIYSSRTRVDDLNICTDNYDVSSHFKSIVIQYAHTGVSSQHYRLIGTNAGLLHMFNVSNNLEEVWTFIPNELFNIIPKSNSEKTDINDVYGTGNVYIQDANNDGVINTNEGDKAWLYFGLGRGSSYYAIDISQPQKPKLMWHINDKTPGFSQLSQTWSKINIGFSKINHTPEGDKKPVAFLSAGYDEKDDKGKGLYLIDAESGKLLFSITPELTNRLNLQWQGGTHSIPSSLATMDSDSDGYIDRIYVGDAGANIWRIDMPGNKPFSNTSPWTIHRFANLVMPSNSDTSVNTHQKDPVSVFFSEPTIARALMPHAVNISEDDLSRTKVVTENKAFDVIVFGSGNKAKLDSTAVHNTFYMLKDSNIFTQSFSPSIGNAIPKVITESDLFNFTDNPYDNISSVQKKEQLNLAISQSRGWLIDYEQSGESTASQGVILSGVVYMSTYLSIDHSTDSSSHFSNEQIVCSPNNGKYRLYAINLFNGASVYNFRSVDRGSFTPSEPSTLVPEQLAENISEDRLTIQNEVLNITSVDSVHEELGGVLIMCDGDNCGNKNPKELIPQTSTSSEDSSLLDANGEKLKLKIIRSSLYIQD